MKTRTSKFLVVFCAIFTVSIASFYDYAPASAQQTTTVKTPTPAQTKTPTPKQTVTPTPKQTVTPTPSPTPDPLADDGPIVVDTELVNLNVRVIDRFNKSIGNLKQGDFKIYEDNVVQNIEFFSKAEVPTNYAMVIDNSNSLRSQLEKVIEASKIIVGTNKPEDETAIIRFVNSEKIEITQDFTSNKTDINEALDNLYVEGGQTAIIDAVYLAAERVDEYEKTKNPDDRKRRALIIVSDGEDRDSYYKEQQLFQLLRESDVQIFAVGFVNELTKEGGFISKSPQEKAKNLLTRLSQETGGKAYFPNNLSELPGIARDIASELRTQYLVAYSPTNDRRDGTFRTIKVVVADGPNKEKRIAVTRSGRSAPIDNKGSAPTLQSTKPKTN